MQTSMKNNCICQFSSVKNTASMKYKTVIWFTVFIEVNYEVTVIGFTVLYFCKCKPNYCEFFYVVTKLESLL